MFFGHLFLLLVTCFYVEQCHKFICSATGFWIYMREKQQQQTNNKRMNKRRTIKINLSQYSDLFNVGIHRFAVDFAYFAVLCINSCHIRTQFLSQFGLAVRHEAGKQKGLGSIPLRLYFFLKKVVVCGQCFVILSLTINETLKWPSSPPIIMQESFWWWQCSDRYIIISFLSPPSPYPLPPFSPSLISLVVSVDVNSGHNSG